jgi:hypothetical protein
MGQFNVSSRSETGKGFKQDQAMILGGGFGPGFKNRPMVVDGNTAILSSAPKDPLSS